MTVAILDLSAAPDLLPAPAPTVRPAWRTSFGSERHTAPEPKPTARNDFLAALDGIDAVLIHGVASARPLRRIFPPRRWRIVISRHAASRLKATGGPATTAIAIRARPDLRVTGRIFALRHTPAPNAPEPQAEIAAANLDIADLAPIEDASGDEDVSTPISGTIGDVVATISEDRGPVGAASTKSDADSPATAVRLLAGGKTFWLAAMALPRACAAEDAPCPALQDADLWRSEKQKLGQPALIGGRMNADDSSRTDEQKAIDAPDETANGKGCTTYAIEADLVWHRLSTEAGGISPEPGKGCIVTLQIGG